jgi:Tub family
MQLATMKVVRANTTVECAPKHPHLRGAEDPQEAGQWIHETPNKKHCESTTGRVHCTLRRSAAFAGSGLVIFQVDRCKHLRLYAKRGEWYSKIKYTIHDTAMAPIGWLRQVKSNFSCHVYELAMVGARKAAGSGNADARGGRINRESTPAAMISYNVPSLKEFISMSPPRRARIVLIPNYRTSNSEGAPLQPDFVDKPWKVESGSLAGQPTEAPTALLESKEPYLKANGRRGLDFAGRGSGSSCKNMQLVQALEGCGEPKAALQMVKWQAKDGSGVTNAKEKVYHVDFAAPITPFQAFGFALAQLDL